VGRLISSAQNGSSRRGNVSAAAKDRGKGGRKGRVGSSWEKLGPLEKKAERGKGVLVSWGEKETEKRKFIREKETSLPGGPGHL